MRRQNLQHDVTVVGGGLAGVCAAIAAARRGLRVALVTNRPVLGGNSSSEVRVWVVGASGHGRNRWARETGIMGELWLENQYRNPEGNPYFWDAVVLDAVRAEPSLDLFLNTDVREVEASGPPDARRVDAVTGWTMGSELLTRFEAPVFLDCTGDGLVGHLAGAEHRTGVEARSEYGEPWAPDEANSTTLGSSLLFYSKDAGAPVRFVPPRFAADITASGLPERRIIKADEYGCAYWWIEFGGELDTIHDNERIRDELWSVVWGIWDHIKNSGLFDADNLTLEWVGSVPGKRESRRFVGDHVLTQLDIVGQTDFADKVAFGGWSIDLHPPGGMYSPDDGALQRYADGLYDIPYRALYPRNTTNLLVAGRNISASHVAYASTRVMATCAVIGEAAGTAAALSVEGGVAPRDVDVQELQQVLLRQDASIVGLPNQDPEDLARRAEATASGTRTRLEVTDAVEPWPLEVDAALVLPVDPVLDGLELLVDAAEAATLTVEVYDPGRGQNYVPTTLVGTATAHVEPGEKQWVRLDVGWRPGTPRNAFVRVKAHPALALYAADHPTPGVLSMSWRPLRPKDEPPQPVREWSPRELERRTLCFRAGTTDAFAPAKSVDGYQRPYGGPHQWVSAPLSDGEAAWLRLGWERPVTVGRVELTFDDDVEEDIINLHHHRTPFEVIPTLVRDYRVEGHVDGVWREVARAEGNRHRRAVHVLGSACRADAVRVVVTATNGAPEAHVVAVRVYAA